MEFLDDTGRIIDDGPMIFWKIKANFHIFSVSTNQIVRSKINRCVFALSFTKSLDNQCILTYRIGRKYIGCILVNCIDVTIKYDEEIENDVEEYVSSNLSVEDDIIFKVNSFVPSQRYIEGIIDSDVFKVMTDS